MAPPRGRDRNVLKAAAIPQISNWFHSHHHSHPTERPSTPKPGSPPPARRARMEARRLGKATSRSERRAMKENREREKEKNIHNFHVIFPRSSSHFRRLPERITPAVWSETRARSCCWMRRSTRAGWLVGGLTAEGEEEKGRGERWSGACDAQLIQLDPSAQLGQFRHRQKAKSRFIMVVSTQNKT